MKNQVSPRAPRGRPAEWRGPTKRQHHRQARRCPDCRSIRASELATSGLFWSSPCSTSIGLPNTEPPKSSIASSTATRLPGPPTSRYGPPISLSSPMRTGLDVLCARIIPGTTNGAAANVPTAPRRVMFSIMDLSPEGLAERPVQFLQRGRTRAQCRFVHFIERHRHRVHVSVQVHGIRIDIEQTGDDFACRVALLEVGHRSDPVMHVVVVGELAQTQD